jgi:hypothetical protein
LLLAIEEEVEIQRARSVPRTTRSPSAGGEFGFSQKGEERPCRETRPPDDDGVEVVGLIVGAADGGGFIEG